MQSVIEVINSWVNTQPQAVAVQAGQSSLSYQQLDHLSNNVAINLQAKGVAVGDVVAICMPREITIWPVILGIFKAGAIYLPVEQQWPLGRVEAVLKQAACRFIVGDSAAGNIPSAQKLLAPDTLVKPASAAPSFSPLCCDTAYIIFTSGSTGQPKGVAITHHSLWHLLDVMKNTLALDNSLRQLCITSFAFDLVMPDLFLPLVTGGCCVLDNGAAINSPQCLADQLSALEINLLQATPGTFQTLTDSGWPGSNKLQIIIGGDKVPKALADNLATKVKKVWHCYGPTEATVWSAIESYPVNGQLAFSGALPGYSFYLVDEQGQLVTHANGKGELLIAGKGLALGYIGQPQLTGQKFVDLGLPEGVQRVYKTGDIFQYDENMRLNYRGRVDNQVKLSGHRVELGEIESLAETVSGVTRFVAEPRKEQLTGFYTATDNPEVIEKAIKAELEARLPWYMLPTQYIHVAALPLNANQKVDRKALHAINAPTDLPPANKERESETFTYYKTQIQLAWRDAFDSDIDENANCFDEGMDSLKVVSLLVAIEARLQLNLAMTFVYSHPGIAEMAAALESQYHGSAASDELSQSPQLIKLQSGEGTPLVCIHPVGGGVFHYRLIAKYLQSVSVYGLQAQGYDGGEPLYDVVTMAERYAGVIEKSLPTKNVRLLGGSMGGVLAVETAKQLKAKNIHVEDVYLLDAVGRVEGGNHKRRPISFKGVVRGLSLRLKDNWMQLKAKLIFSVGARLPHVWRYQYLTLVNHKALDKYLASEHYEKKYQGRVILFRLPPQPEGQYSDKCLGWDKIINPEPIVYYAQGRHHQFLESKDFELALKAHY